ncbi:MAG: Gldg family protein [Acidobacteriota bacterium]
MGGKVNFRIVQVLAKRDLRMYFSNPSGYVFITLFIFLSAAAAFWQDRFFLNNLANLDQLNGVFPYLLLFFVPALTMGVWAEERKQGTDELLLTLPATDLEVVLGKYMATLGIYTASLVLSLSHVVVLLWLGGPDLGLMFGNYMGYWLVGAALIAVGMLGSLLTANVTIAFILGAGLCALVSLADGAVGVFSESLGRFVSPLGVFNHFRDFAGGVVSFSAILYFVSTASFFVYLNVLLIERRHWPRNADGYPMWFHHLVRGVAIFVALVSVNALAGRTGLRLDVTAEQLHSLSDETRRLFDEVSEERPVFIQAFISPEVPEHYVQTQSNLLGLLEEIDAVAGPKVEVLIEETEPYTEVARAAREKFGIMPRQIPNLSSARAGFEDVFLGLAFTCGAEEQVIPFFDRGLPAEYEIARSIRVVAKTGRKRIGVVNTAIRLFGGLDFQTMRSTPPWSVVEELEKQYQVVQINPALPIAEEVDGLLVILPSSLPQKEMDNVRAFIEEGHPALLLVDPLPIVNIGLAPSERAGANMNPFLRQGQPPPKPKGNVQQFLAELGVRWDSIRVVWDSYNPHPDLAHLPQEVVFVGQGNENPEAFNQNHRASAGLQELVLLYPGQLAKAEKGDVEFEPLVRSGQISGSFAYFQMVQRSFFGTQLNRNLPHRPDDKDYILAAQVRLSRHSPGDDDHDGDDNGEAATKGDTEEEAESSAESVNVIVVADLDFVSEQFFEIRRMGPPNLNFDNVSFFLNCIDVLVGDDSFVGLRNRRLKHRTLERVEAQTRSFVERRAAEEQQAEEEAERALADAQKRLNERVQEVRERADLDAQAKQIMARNLQEVENRRLEVLKANIESEKEAKIQASKEKMESQIRQIQSTIRTFAVLLPPIPVFALGVVIFVRRQKREREGAAAARRLRA